MPLSISVDECLEGVLDAEQFAALERQLERMLEAVDMGEDTERPVEADLRLTDDKAIRELNRDYRGKDKATDVLAFAQREGEGGMLCPEILGDIVISIETAKAQAKSNLHDELVFLAAHGLCHLLGYDHNDDEEELAMNSRMKELMDESLRSGPVQAA